MQYDRKDHLYRKAKAAGLRSRASFKLEELNGKFKLFKPGYSVLDLGAWPGGWLQYILECIGENGKAVGIDLTEIEALNDTRALLLQGDASDDSLIMQALEFSGRKFDSVVSDMSRKLTGVKEADQAGSAAVFNLAYETALRTLRKGGSFVCKTFKGPDTDAVFNSVKKSFSKMVRSELEASRKTSNEYYVIGLGLK